MINWETIKAQSITNINDIVNDAGAVLLNGLSDTKKAGIDLKVECQFHLDNYKSACSNSGVGQDISLVNRATAYIG